MAGAYTSRTEVLLRPMRAVARTLVSGRAGRPFICREGIRKQNHHDIDQIGQDAAAYDEYRTSERAKVCGEPLKAVGVDECHHCRQCRDN